jgi:hypothetical protein
MSDNMAYLSRQFARLGDAAVQSAQQGRLHVMSEATKLGALHGSRMFLLVKEEYVRAAKDAAVKMARLAYDVTGSTDQPVCDQITNSPGAVLQSGVGNVQTATASTFAPSDVRSALLQFLNSQDVQGLANEDKQSVADVAEVLGNELDKPQPDASKIARWGRRLVEIAERLGIGVAVSVLSRALGL